MKISYRYRILAYFLLVLIATSLLFTFILIRRESQFKLEQLSYRIQPYSDILYSSIKGFTSREDIEKLIDTLGETIPAELRVTILDSSAWVIFDNFSHRETIMDNHLNRPELAAAAKEGTGSAIRYSKTLKSDYLYFAKKYPDMFIRVALEYRTSVLPVIKNDKTWQIYIILVFLTASAVLVYITRQISKPYSALKEFIERVEHGEEDYDEVRFPKDEMGEVGEKIMNAFRQLENTKKYKQELTHNVAHELKTPVTGIRGYLETLLQQENLDKDQIKFFLEQGICSKHKIVCNCK
ncbi:hypothetical protein MASR2M69_21370 [Bacteroidota bacterium]